MSGTAIVWYKLKTDSELTALIPAASIFSGHVPINAPLPAIGITSVSTNHIVPLDGTASNRLVTERVQVTVYAKTYPLLKSYMSAIRSALPISRGIINGFVCDSILPSGEGPDIYDDRGIIYEQSLDFMVRYARV